MHVDGRLTAFSKTKMHHPFCFSLFCTVFSEREIKFHSFGQYFYVIDHAKVNNSVIETCIFFDECNSYSYFFFMARKSSAKG